MVCPKCGEKLKVVDSANTSDEILRKRKCTKCEHTLYTIEYEVENDEPFNKQWTKYNRAYVRYRNK